MVNVERSASFGITNGIWKIKVQLLNIIAKCITGQMSWLFTRVASALLLHDT